MPDTVTALTVMMNKLKLGPCSAAHFIELVSLALSESAAWMCHS